jgi:hypothetical protein
MLLKSIKVNKTSYHEAREAHEEKIRLRGLRFFVVV